MGWELDGCVWGDDYESVDERRRRFGVVYVGVIYGVWEKCVRLCWGFVVFDEYCWCLRVYGVVLLWLCVRWVNNGGVWGWSGWDYARVE